MYTLQRRKVKDKLDALGRQLTDEFQNSGLALVMHLSDDHPSLWNNKKVDMQWLFFSRDIDAERELSEIIDTEKTLAATLVDPTPLYRHIFLGVSVNESALDVGIRLHHDAWVDRKNLLAILADSEKRNGLLTLCRNLPGHIGFGLHQEDLTAMSDVNEEVLQSFQSAFDTSSKGWMFWGAHISKDDAIARGASVREMVIETMNQLVPVYKYIAWSPQNDALSIDAIVEQKKQKRQATHEELLQEQKAREEKQRELVAERQRKQEEKKQDMLDEQAWREQERAKRRAAAFARREKEAQMQAEIAAAPAPVNTAPASPKAAASEASTENRGNEAPARQRPPRDHADNDSRRRRSERTTPGRERSAASDRSHNKDRGRTSKGKGSRKPFQSTASKPANVSDERKADIQVGDRIAVVSGLLKNRNGVVQSIDEKGDLKVSFGMLSSRVARQDVKGLGPAI